MSYRVGIIGCGRMASTIDDERQGPRRSGLVPPHAHAGGYARVPEVEMVAACDVDAAKLQAFQERWKVPRGYADFRELIEREHPDILSITTRPEQHAEAMVYAAEHGVKGIYAEKPLCCSLAEADAIRQAFERHGVFLEFGPMRRNWTVYQQARAIAASGEMGEVRSVIGFALNAIGGHLLDTLLYLLGDPEPVTVRGTLGTLFPAEGDTSGMRFIKDTAIRSALVDFANGATLHVAGTGVWGEFEIFCSEGLIRVENDGESLTVRRRDGQSRAYDRVPVETPEHWCGTERKVRDLVEAIRTGKPGVSNLRAATLGLEIGFGIYQSHLQGGVEVRLPVENRERWVSSW